MVIYKENGNDVEFNWCDKNADTAYIDIFPEDDGYYRLTVRAQPETIQDDQSYVTGWAYKLEEKSTWKTRFIRMAVWTIGGCLYGTGESTYENNKS